MPRSILPAADAAVDLYPPVNSDNSYMQTEASRAFATRASELQELFADGLPYTAWAPSGTRAGTIARPAGSRARWHVLAVLTPEQWAENPLAARVAAFAHTHDAVDFRVVTPVQGNALLARKRLDPVDPRPLFILLNAAFEEVSSWGEQQELESVRWWLPVRRGSHQVAPHGDDEFIAALGRVAA